jgi:hypothetical protein
MEFIKHYLLRHNSLSDTRKNNFSALLSIYDQINLEIDKLSNQIYDHIVEIDNKTLFKGEIPLPSDPYIKMHIDILNKLFSFVNRNKLQMVIKRKVIEDYNKKIFSKAMCSIGGQNLDLLCDIVNNELKERYPSNSPARSNANALDQSIYKNK